MSEKSVRLAAGELRVAVEQSDLPLEFLCDFASRRNPKRPFLFVSRVLGRHLPVAPQTMRMVHRRLAAKLGPALPGPALVIGMAETAVGLGHGIHEAWRQMSRRHDLLYLHSTRYHIDAPLLSHFEESHSHATSHLLYWPQAAEDAALLTECRTLVLVDDEASTGATFVAVAESCWRYMPQLSQIICVTITDWMGRARRAEIAHQMPVPSHFVSLLQGQYQFLPSGAPPPAMPNVTGNGGMKDHLLPANWGRLGRRTPTPLPAAATHLPVRRGERILVLGTGEFVYPPFQLARHLAAQGAEVAVQATTRSPILPGGPIHDTLEFLDAYEDGIPNFLYSVTPGQYDRVLVCYETPPSTAQHSLLTALGGEPIFFSPTEE